jgi:hypothetical protein
MSAREPTAAAGSIGTDFGDQAVFDPSEAATQLAFELDRALEEGQTNFLSADALRLLMEAVCRSYAARASRGGDETSGAALALAGDIDRALNEGRADILSEAAVQALMAVACRSYSAQIEGGGGYLPLSDRSRVTSTDVMVSASGLLKAANLAVFELGMWQSWTGR